MKLEWGEVDIDLTDDGKNVRMEAVHEESGSCTVLYFTPEQARKHAAALVELANQIDGGTLNEDRLSEEQNTQ